VSLFPLCSPRLHTGRLPAHTSLCSVPAAMLLPPPPSPPARSHSLPPPPLPSGPLADTPGALLSPPGPPQSRGLVRLLLWRIHVPRLVARWSIPPHRLRACVSLSLLPFPLLPFSPSPSLRPLLTPSPPPPGAPSSSPRQCDDLVTIWAPREGRIVARCPGHASFVRGIAFDPWRWGADDRIYRFASVGEDNRIILVSGGGCRRPWGGTARCWKLWRGGHCKPRAI
jgi:hypothetical protein